MLILAGLGNPGPKHENNRHNVGFMAADAIARRHSFSPWSKKFQGLIAEGRIGDEKVLLLKPQTFMNLSGQTVGEAMRFYKLAPADVTGFRLFTGAGSSRNLKMYRRAGYRPAGEYLPGVLSLRKRRPIGP